MPDTPSGSGMPPTPEGSAALGSGRPARRRPGSRPVAVVTVVLGAIAVLACSGQPWAQATVPGLPGTDVVTADGRLVAPGAAALALVAGAGAIVLATAGRVVRLVVAGLLVLAGAGVIAFGTAVLVAPADAVSPAVEKATGTTGAAAPAGARATAWPGLVVAGGVLMAAGGVTGLARGRRWAGPSRRFERTTSVPGGSAAGVDGRVAVGKEARLDAWDRLSDGDDPTD